MTAQHVIKGGALRRPDNHGINVKRLGCVDDGFGGIVRNRPDRDSFEAFAANLLQGGT